MTALCLFLLVIAFPISWAGTAFARRLGLRVNALDGAGVAGQVKAPPRRVPNTGGLGIFIGIALPLILGLWFFHGLDTSETAQWRTDLSLIPADAADYIAGIQKQTPAALFLLGALFLLHLVGLFDDRRPLGPYLKLVIMLGVTAAVVIWTDSRLLTLLDGRVGGKWLSIAITILWIGVITNAFNFLDNMDGLSGGVAAICATFFLVTALVAGQWFVAAMLALLVGSLLGFLRYNFPWTRSGASIFMGDGGSLIVGFLLAVMSVRLTYPPLLEPDIFATSSLRHFVTSNLVLLTPLIILAVPLYDFCSVTLIRLRQGKSPFVGDLQHFSHRLVRHGLSRRAAVVVIYGCTAVTGIGAIALPKLEPWQAILVGVQTLLVLLVIAMYEWARTPDGANPPGERP